MYHKPDRRLLCLGLCSLVSFLLIAQTASASSSSNPDSRVDLAAIGYHEPSRAERIAEDAPAISLDFVDDAHVLVTYNRKKLFKRLPGCTPAHNDRYLHAAILEVPSGRIVAETDWYVHDRRRYLWPMGPGKFLLRRLNDLYVVDAQLHEKLVWSSPKDLLWVSVTPDASQIIVETEKDTAKAKAAKPTAVAPPKYQAQFIDVATLIPLRTIPFHHLTNVTGTSTGYADLIHKGDIWLVRFGPTPTKRSNIARVRSRTMPTILYSGDNSLVIGRCAGLNCDYSVTAFTLSGHRLWAQHWERFRVFPAISRSQDAGRIVVSSLRLAADSSAVKAAASVDQTDDVARPNLDELDVFQQEVQVLDAASGSPVSSVTIKPAMQDGQNVSLSPDGRRLAVVHGASLELYDLPSSSSEEQSKFAALKSDKPELIGLADADPGALDEDAAADSVDMPATTDTSNAALEKVDYSLPAAGARKAEQPSSADANNADSVGTDQNTATKADLLPTFRVVTRAVAVDVVVTDSKGHPIRGLRQEDFHLSEDGKPQEVRAFRVFTDTPEPDNAPNTIPSPAPAPETASATSSAGAAPTIQPVPATPVVTPPTPPSPNVFTNQTRTPDSGAVTMVLFDMLNTAPGDQVYARQQLIKFLQKKPKISQFALCTLSAGDGRLVFIQGFTDDENKLLAAAKGKKGLPTKGVRWQESASESQQSVNTVAPLTLEGNTSGFQNLLGALQSMQAEQQVIDTTERAGFTIDAMSTLSRYLSGIPGRKNLVWLSGSFPVSLVSYPGLIDATDSGDPAIDNPNFAYKIKRVTNLLADAQVAVYAVDARGLIAGGPDASAPIGAGQNSAPPLQGSNSAPAAARFGNFADQDRLNFAQQFAEHDTLEQFAKETGGKAFYNTNGIMEAISIANEQGSNYYTLSYSPTNKDYNGKFRKIKVALAAKGYTLHYREGYFADDTNTAAKDADYARRSRATAMQHGSPLSRQVMFSARVVPIGNKKKIDSAAVGEVLIASTKKRPILPATVEAQHYLIDYSFDGSQVRFVPQPDSTYRNTLTLMVSSFDADGKMLSAVANIGTRDFQPAAYQKASTGQFGIFQEVDIPADAASLRVGVQDQMSNHIGTLDVHLPVPPTAESFRRVRLSLPPIEPD